MIPMPAAVVLIVCKVVEVGPGVPETGWKDLEWDTSKYSMMECRRQEVALPNPVNSFAQCQREGVMAAAEWDSQHSKYKTWRTACPVPVIDTRTGNIIAWKLPECGHRDTVRCDVDTEI